MVFDVDLEIKEDLAVLNKHFDTMDRFIRYFCSIKVLSLNLFFFYFIFGLFEEIESLPQTLIFKFVYPYVDRSLRYVNLYCSVRSN